MLCSWGAARGDSGASHSAAKPVLRMPGVNALKCSSLRRFEGRFRRPELDSEATESPNESREVDSRGGRWIGTGSLLTLSPKLLAASSLSLRRSKRRKGTTLRLAELTWRTTGGVALREGALLLNKCCGDILRAKAPDGDPCWLRCYRLLDLLMFSGCAVKRSASHGNTEQQILRGTMILRGRGLAGVSKPQALRCLMQKSRLGHLWNTRDIVVLLHLVQPLLLNWRIRRCVYLRGPCTRVQQLEAYWH